MRVPRELRFHYVAADEARVLYCDDHMALSAAAEAFIKKLLEGIKV